MAVATASHKYSEPQKGAIHNEQRQKGKRKRGGCGSYMVIRVNIKKARLGLYSYLN